MAYNRIVARGETSSNPFVNSVERPGQLIAEQFEEAVVVDVIVNNHHEEYAKDGYNVGAVKFRFINSNYFRPDETLHWAFSMDANRSDYPLLNEVIYVFQGLNRFYYMRKFNVSSRVTAQGMFGINEEAQPVPGANEGIQTLRESTANPIKPAPADGSGLGKYFIDQPKVWRLKHLEGDIIYEGRSGASIRMGTAWLDGKVGVTARPKIKPWQSLQRDQAPNIMIRVGPDPTAERTVDTPYGQVIEEINKDQSSIWMVTDQIVPLIYSTQKSGIHKVSVPDFPSRLTGNQIIVNTDRFVVNAKTDKILGHSALGIHWTTLQNFSVDADRDHVTWTNRDRADRVVRDWRETIGRNKNETAGGNMVRIAGGSQQFGAGGPISFVGPKIHIGSANASSEPLVLGATLRAFLDQLINILVLEPIVQVTNMPGAPSPQNPVRITALQQLRAQYLTGGNAARILSLDNFTIRDNQREPKPRNIRPYIEG
jgi:hypothetical protein